MRVAILDVDYHHGNGTQDIFYEREDVVTCSIHADSQRKFPYFTRLNLPTVVVLEGGYSTAAIGANVVSFLRGLAS
jgi:acetoin utilization deacetylase AcuC-like enzyme